MSTTTERKTEQPTETISEVIDLDATEKQWLEARRKFIGASESAAIFGCGYANQSPVTVYESKVFGRPDQEEAKRLRIGKMMEPVLRKLFEEETGLRCVTSDEPMVVMHPTIAWLGATLDGFTVENDCRLPVELKNVDYHKRKEWEEEPPLKYQIQLQHQLAVTGAGYGYLFALLGGNEPVVKRMDRNDRFIAALIAKLEEFWNYVVNGQMPPIDASEATQKALARMYPKDNGETVTLDTEACDWAIAFENAKLLKRQAEADEKKYGNLLKAAIADASFAIIPGFGKYSCKTAKRDGYSVEPITYRTLRKMKG